MAIALSNIVNIFAIPNDVFQNIKTSPKWLIAFLFMFIVSATCGYFMEPFTQKVMEHTLSAKMSDEQVRQTLDVASRFHFLLLLFSAVPLFAKWLFISLFLYLGAILLNAEKTNFRNIYSAVVHSELILLLMLMLNVLILHVKGVESVNNITDLNAIIGLEYFLGDKIHNIPLYTFLNNFNVFSIWYLVILIIGISVICQIEKWKSAILVSSVLLLGVGVQVAFVSLSENMQHMMGS